MLLCALALQVAAQIPTEAERWRNTLTRNARMELGLEAPVAMLAAQVHQESGWRPDARSYVGALGMSQFMPATATWLAGAYEHLGPADPLNPVWALRGMVVYDGHLFDRVRAANVCERWAKALSAYNGGLGYIAKDERLAKSKGLDPLRWFGHVETVNAVRRPSAWQENRGYPRRILRELEPRYIAAGWGMGACR
ncbi:MAG: transglycosylase SLT domain-containing protein [Burkholderiales bacterium]|nr:transglycosylase SLT domain-containing protein [Burkholderiales bacterium]